MTKKRNHYKIAKNRSTENFTAEASKYPQGYFNPKPCRECGNLFKPFAPSHMYCSDDCAALGHDRRRMEKNYGISLEEYYDLVEKHAGKCAICGGEGFELVKGQNNLLVIDHCHSSLKVRGLLCHNCNRGLGLFQDGIENLLNAVEYLKRNRE